MLQCAGWIDVAQRQFLVSLRDERIQANDTLWSDMGKDGKIYGGFDVEKQCAGRSYTIYVKRLQDKDCAKASSAEEAAEEAAEDLCFSKDDTAPGDPATREANKKYKKFMKAAAQNAMNILMQWFDYLGRRHASDPAS